MYVFLYSFMLCYVNFANPKNVTEKKERWRDEMIVLVVYNTQVFLGGLF